MMTYGPAAISLSPLPVPVTNGCPDCDCDTPATWLLSVEEQSGESYSVPQCPECAGEALAGMNALMEKGVPLNPLYGLTHWRSEPELIVALALAERDPATLGHVLGRWQRRRKLSVADMRRLLHTRDTEPVALDVYVLFAEQHQPDTDAELRTLCAAAHIKPWRLQVIVSEDRHDQQCG